MRIILITLLLTACGGEVADALRFNASEYKRLFSNFDEQLMGKTTVFGVSGPPEGATDIYKAGWHDGCNTGTATYGNDFYRSSYSFYQNPEYVNNVHYYRAWKDAYSYCRYYTGFSKFNLWGIE